MSITPMRTGGWTDPAGEAATPCACSHRASSPGMWGDGPVGAQTGSRWPAGHADAHTKAACLICRSLPRGWTTAPRVVEREPQQARLLRNILYRGAWGTGLSSGHDLTVREFEPRIRLCADSLEPGACFRFCVSLSLCSSPTHALSLSPSKIS